MKKSRTVAAVLCALLFGFVAAREIDAQGTRLAQNGAPTARIQVMLVAATNGMPPTVFRRASIAPRNVIMLDPTKVSTQQLSDAIFSLTLLEAHDPSGRTRSDNLARRARLQSKPPVYPWAAEILGRLKIASERPVAGLGRRRAVEIWVDPFRGRAR